MLATFWNGLISPSWTPPLPLPHSIPPWSAAKKRMSLEIGDIGYLISIFFAALQLSTCSSRIPIDSIYSPPHAAFLWHESWALHPWGITPLHTKCLNRASIDLALVLVILTVILLFLFFFSSFNFSIFLSLLYLPPPTFRPPLSSQVRSSC